MTTTQAERRDPETMVAEIAQEREARAVMVAQPAAPVAVVLWGTNDPGGMVTRMGVVATALATAIKERRMSKRMSDRADAKEYVFAEGWALAGALIGIFPRTSALDEVRGQDGDLYGYQATVRLCTRDGDIVGEAMAMCTRDEERWEDSDWNQIASMAQTRATGKAFRGTLGFVMQMAGYAPTPAEEMEGVFNGNDAPPAGERRTVEAQASAPRAPRAPRASAANARPATERRNGVALPEVVKDVASLLLFARFHWGADGASATPEALGAENVTDLRRVVDKDYAGDWDLAAQKLRATWGAPEAAPPVSQEAPPDIAAADDPDGLPF